MVGTMVLVLMGCGSAVFAGDIAAACGTGVGTLGVALAFGLSVVAMAYTIGGISGCHINPAITLGVYLSKRISGKDAAFYMLFQVIGAFIGSAIIYELVSTGAPAGGTATGVNSFGVGVVLGIFLIAKIIEYLFQRFPSQTFAAIIGLIVSSPFAILYSADALSGFSVVELAVGLVLAGLGRWGTPVTGRPEEA